MRRRCILLLVLGGALILQTGSAQDSDNSRAATLLEKINIVDFSKPTGTWSGASVGQSLAFHDRLRTGEESRAAAKLGDASVLRVDELTTIEILAPKQTSAKATLDMKQGSTYFFSRERGREISFQTPAANGAIRGTSFLLTVTAQLRTILVVLKGEVALWNDYGSVLVHAHELAIVDLRSKPEKHAIDEHTPGVRLFIESKLSRPTTLANATPAELLASVRAAIEDVGTADCGLIAAIVAAAITAQPNQASAIFELAISLAPNCRAILEQLGHIIGGETKGIFGNPPANINPPPGSVGSGAGQNRCLVCHNSHEMSIPCDQIDKFVHNHPGDQAGPCQPTPVTNP